MKSKPKHENKFPGYPKYPVSEDIFNHDKEEKDINPEDISKTKEPNELPGTRNEKDFNEDKSGKDLDVPGSELDDKQEINGNEDEENNFYSIGGDNHNDLDERKSE
ncbi:MAG: hypothetical protein SGI87_09495 [Flavobacteriales bacterium]|nr:hypothetical protein [Flavobacteriales bacterium]